MRAPTTLRRIDMVVGLVVAVFGVFVLVQSLQLSFYANDTPGPGFFPSLLGIALIVVGAGISASRLRASKRTDDDFRLPSRGQVTHSLVLWAVIFVASLAVGVLGFTVTMVLLVAFVLFVLEGRRKIGSVIATIAIPAAVWLLFGWLLQVPLPTGPFGI